MAHIEGDMCMFCTELHVKTKANKNMFSKVVIIILVIGYYGFAFSNPSKIQCGFVFVLFTFTVSTLPVVFRLTIFMIY